MYTYSNVLLEKSRESKLYNNTDRGRYMYYINSAILCRAGYTYTQSALSRIVYLCSKSQLVGLIITVNIILYYTELMNIVIIHIII